MYGAYGDGTKFAGALIMRLIVLLIFGGLGGPLLVWNNQQIAALPRYEMEHSIPLLPGQWIANYTSGCKVPRDWRLERVTSEKDLLAQTVHQTRPLQYDYRANDSLVTIYYCAYQDKRAIVLEYRDHHPLPWNKGKTLQANRYGDRLILLGGTDPQQVERQWNLQLLIILFILAGLAPLIQFLFLSWLERRKRV